MSCSLTKLAEACRPESVLEERSPRFIGKERKPGLESAACLGVGGATDAAWMAGMAASVSKKRVDSLEAILTFLRCPRTIVPSNPNTGARNQDFWAMLYIASRPMTGRRLVVAQSPGNCQSTGHGWPTGKVCGGPTQVNNTTVTGGIYI